ncbi:MAG: aminoglycoside phosphotransferase family protein [Actinomycetia bacterium]|nr:aminoglycoside phosphotransferase family protein [Actinomycetes bacterium]
MTTAQTHDLSFTDAEVRKRYVDWERGEPDREWACLTVLATHAPGIAPTPLRREVDPDGSPVIVMSRLPGAPLGDAPFTSAQTVSLGEALRRTYAIPADALVEAGVVERVYGPSTLPDLLVEWLSEPYDLARCQDPGLVEHGISAALTWLSQADALPPAELVVLGVSDRKPANLVWDGQTCRLVDFEDSGTSDLAYELADQIEHIASRLTAQLDPEALVGAVKLSVEQRDRMQRYRPLWAAFWLAMLLPGNGGVRRNPPGTTEEQVRHLVPLIS